MHTLKQYQIEKIPSVGAEFNPEVHEALGTMPVGDDQQDGKIMQVVSEGYRFKDHILRAAQVLVGKKAWTPNR